MVGQQHAAKKMVVEKDEEDDGIDDELQKMVVVVEEDGIDDELQKMVVLVEEDGVDDKLQKVMVVEEEGAQGGDGWTKNTIIRKSFYRAIFTNTLDSFCRNIINMWGKFNSYFSIIGATDDK